MLGTTWSYTYPKCIKLSSHEEAVPGPLLGRDPFGLIQTPRVSDHSVFAFWVVAYGRFDCITLDSFLTDTSMRWTPLEVK